MRRLAAVFLVAIGALLALAPAALGKRALIAFIPTQPAPKMPLLFDLQERNFSYGAMSPTLGAYTKRQMLLDMSQGTRIANNAYSHPLGLVSVEYGQGRNRMVGWFYDAHRAEVAPGDVFPGLFASTLGARGIRVAYSGVIGFEQTEAIVAAGRKGGLGPVSLGTQSTFVKRTLALWSANQVVVARFPGDDAGLEALDQIVAAKQPGDLIFVVRAPPPGQTRLLPTGILGPGYPGGRVLYSDSTRRPGLVAATDMAPTILHFFGIPVPRQMQGRIIDARKGGDAEAVREQMARLDVVLGRRNPALRTWALGILALFAALWAARRRAGLRVAARVSFLAALWLPGCCLVTAAIAPSRAAELLGLAIGSIALGAITDRLVRWPLAPLVPAALVFGAHAIDLARGSPLIGASIAGPNPKGGSRFFGIGNELEIWLSLEVLFGLAAALTLVPRRWVPRLFAIGGLVAAAIMGSGRLGADVGAVITLGAGTAAAVLASLGGRPSRRAIVIACLVPVLGVLALIGLDLVTAGGAHLTRTVIHGNGIGDQLDTIHRRLTISVNGFKQTEIAIISLLGAVGAVLAIRRREAFLAPLRDYPAWIAGLWGGLAATVIGAAANDSGPLMLALGFILLALAAGYAHSRPRRAEPEHDLARAPSRVPAAAAG